MDEQAKYPKLDERTEKEILELVEKRAKSYVPEWRFHPEEPDVGTALALVFSKLHARTLGQFNKLLRKKQIDFYNRIGIRMRPCSAAEGFVSFSLVNHSVDGVYLQKGTALTSDQEDRLGERVAAQTLEDVYVAPIQIRTIYESKKEPEFIGRLYGLDSEDGESSAEFPFSVFGMQGENQVSHRLAFSHPVMFSFGRTGQIRVAFYEDHEKLLPQEVMALAADPARAVFSYWTEDGWEPFFSQYERDGLLVLEKKKDQPAALRREIYGVNQFWIQMELSDYSLCSKLAFSDMRLTASGPSMAPDYVQSEGMEQERELCFPFGEQPSVYGEVYFACKEALEKHGAWITFSFRESFVKIPVYAGDREGIQWKLIMPHSSIHVSREYDITIEEVIWEYFNGYGWARLFPGREYSNVFSGAEKTVSQKHTLVFQCPDDMEPVYVGAAETCYIRARIRKMNNTFKTEGQYIVPVLSELSFQYEYPEPGLRPHCFYSQNNKEEQFLAAEECLDGLYPWQPFQQYGAQETALYIGLDGPVKEGPVRMLWVMENCDFDRRPALLWEYTGANGRFKELNPDDETEHFRETGLITFEGKADWTAQRMFGETCYWIRVRDISGGYGAGEVTRLPEVKAIYMNTTRIRAVHGGYQEVFSLDQYEENFTHQMLYQKVCDLQLWVNETGSLTQEEQIRLEAEKRLNRVLDENGMTKEIWVLWEETDRFFGRGPGARVYILDANEGRIQFGDNRNGKIPPIGVVNGIWISYSIGGGQETNLPAGGIRGLELAAGFISEATNPLSLSGGYDREGVSEAISRRAKELRHRFRAVTLRDYEALAMEASGSIAKVCCVSGFDEQGASQQGHVSLVILQKDYQAGSHFFPELSRRILEYLRDKADPGLLAGNRLHVMEPVFVEVGIQCEIHIRDYNDSYRVRSELTARLKEYLDPLTGGLNGDGWEIGRLPERESIISVIYSDSRILYAGNIMVHYGIRRGQKQQEFSREEIEKNPYLLTISGNHRIVVRTE